MHLIRRAMGPVAFGIGAQVFRDREAIGAGLEQERGVRRQGPMPQGVRHNLDVGLQGVANNHGHNLFLDRVQGLNRNLEMRGNHDIRPNQAQHYVHLARQVGQGNMRVPEAHVRAGMGWLAHGRPVGAMANFYAAARGVIRGE